MSRYEPKKPDFIATLSRLNPITVTDEELTRRLKEAQSAGLGSTAAALARELNMRRKDAKPA